MVDLGRVNDTISTTVLADQLTELIGMCDASGIEGVYCGEHHGIELTIAPNPFQLLAYWAGQFKNIRFGTAVVSAPYWHPVKLAGEAGLLDVLSEGRFDLGIGRGAYPYEFARMANGMTPEEARGTLDEMLSCLRGLWKGDFAHEGPHWTFPSTTSTPRPFSPEGPPVWVSARHPEVFEMAVRHRCNVMVAPLDLPFREVVSLRDRLDAAVDTVANGWMPEMMVVRKTGVYESVSDRHAFIARRREREGYFNALFRAPGTVSLGFVEPVPPSPDDDSDVEIWENNVLGTPDEVVRKLREYERAGTDVFLYGATWGLDREQEKRSLRLFIDEVMPQLDRKPLTGVGRC